MVGIVAVGILALFFYQTIASPPVGAMLLLLGVLLIVWFYNAIVDDISIASTGKTEDDE